MASDDIPQDPAGDDADRTAPARTAGDVTLILSRIAHGERQAAKQLLPLVYEELRKLAAAKMAQEKPGQTLQTTFFHIKRETPTKRRYWTPRVFRTTRWVT